MRRRFLSEDPTGVRDYWDSPVTVAAYDRSFAQRIGWKWTAVMEELSARGWTLPQNISRIVDWGCGSGIASRIFLENIPAAPAASVRKRHGCGLHGFPTTVIVTHE